MRYDLRGFFEYIYPAWSGSCAQFPLTKAFDKRVESLNHFIHSGPLVRVILHHVVDERFHKAKVFIAQDIVK